ncbi:NADH-quinone oxidoreductase subunit NuoF [Buchnera aphidicola (Neophyllaphis podocarpi)]|uniref:NADH-quinone oxidoreductase subunit NuoF n=1 Tax=Buchnera aphidicola TaxID=9 RepID=UPI0031B89AF4
MRNIIRTDETHPLTWRLRKDQQPVWLKEYCNNNGYASIKKTFNNLNSKELTNIIIESGLRGRGGAGFPTGIKWNSFHENTSKDLTIYLICNADEMEPGTYKDKLLMEQLPHQLIEGMLLGAFAINACIGYIFLRGEYIQSGINLQKAICEAYNAGYLGKNILHSGFSFDIFLHMGAGRYICGEETALINSLEGKRANPRFKPPFPSVSGLWGKPTCVNNVETLSNVPSIVHYGVSWYKNLSKGSDSGTKMMGFSGKVKNPGVWEVPFGISAREILEEYACGMKDNFKLKAWQPGGAGTALLTPSHIDTPMDFTNVQKCGSRLGTAISMAIDNTIDIVSLLLNIEEFFSRESCGWCTPCRDGLPWIVNILKDLKNKKGHEGDIETLENICLDLNPGKTFCAHAPGAISPLLSGIKYFRSEFELGISNKKYIFNHIKGIQSNLLNFKLFKK